MSRQSHDAAFARLVSSSRPLLLGAAQLMFGRPDRAEDVVQLVLAGLYRDWPKGVDARDVALHRVLRANPGQLRAPRRRGEAHFELLDASAAHPLLAAGVIADLADLGDQSRRVLILERWVGWPRPRIAGLLGLPEAEVTTLSDEASTRLVARDPDRRSVQQLPALLRAALPVPDPSTDPAADLAHGRALVRRRTGSRLLVVAALVLVAILGVTQLGPRLQPEHNEARGPVPGPARPTVGCHTTDASCRASVLRAWRTQMAAVTGSYLDPEGGYFSGYTYSADDDRYETSGFFSGGGGAIGFDMFKLGGGSTDVYVQIATSPEHALRCGATTHHACTTTQYMDGNSFALTDTSQTTDGLEVQYAPTGDTVITVIARSTPGGLTLQITRGELVQLAQDDRLRLPTL